MIAFNPTDLPWPVAPATRRWGIFARSTINTSLVIVLPKAIGSSIFDSWNFLEFKIENIETMLGLALGTSIPIVPLPGIGAIIRIPIAAKLSAISSSKFLIFEIRTPWAGVISYKVIVGPTVARILLICTPKSFNTLIILFLFASSSSFPT